MGMAENTVNSIPERLRNFSVTFLVDIKILGPRLFSADRNFVHEAISPRESDK